jgi:Transposase DDE domain
MILNEVFERFVEESPVSVMARAVLENALTPTAVDALFQGVAERQYTRELLFSDVVDLMGAVVCKIRPSINAAYKKYAEALGVTRQAVYDKINRTEPPVGAALVRHTAGALAPVIEAMGGGTEPWLAGYHVKILDGSHLPGTEHRLKPLRAERAGALPGQALVVLDPELMLVLDAIPCEDGHAQERSMTDQVLATVRPGDLWVGDRNFCTTALLFGIAGRGGSFVIRQHASTLTWEAVGPREAKGRCDTGTVFEQAVRLTDGGGGALLVRRVTVELDQPTRDGDRVIHILTDLPQDVADTITVADLYRKRWTLETAFQEMEATLNGEINALGYPRAALFALCVALVAYNVMSAVKGALRSVHGAEAIDGGVSGSDLAEEVAGTTRGMRIAIPADEWAVFHDLSPSAMGRLLQDLARRVRLSEYRKQPRGPKKPKPKKASGYEKKHLSTAKLLKDQESRR